MKSFFAAALLCCRLSVAFGQATATVRPDDPVYGFIDHLVSLRLVDSVLVGQRPMSRSTIARILHAVITTLPVREANEKGRDLHFVGEDSWTAQSLARYRGLYPFVDSTRRPILTRGGLEETYTSSPSRGIPPDGDGSIDVVVDPLLANRLGAPHVNGITLNLFAAGEAPIQSWLTAVAGVRGTAYVARGGPAPRQTGSVDQLYLRGLFRNVAVTVGRDYVFFGQGMTAGITNSLNPGGFDMVRVSSERPFVLPSLLRLLGPMTGTVFLADLGANQYYPHTRLFNYKLSARPFSAFEIGATVTDEMGGQGAPGGTLLQKIEDVFPLLDATILHRVLLFSNKFSGIDARLRVPRARGLQLYMDGALDDFDLRRFKSSVTEDGGYVWGATFDCLGECGRVKVTGEYHATGLRFYTHAIFKSGYVLDHQFIGDQLGPRGKGMYLAVALDRIGRSVTLDLAHEIRSGDKYGATSTTPNDSDFRFVLIEHNPAERRWRSVLTTTVGHPAGFVSTRFSVGGERIEHFAFQPRGWRTNGLLEVRTEFRPGARR